MNFSQKLQELGCEKSFVDPAMFTFCHKEGDKTNKEPTGIAVTHVDDVLSAGDSEFEDNVMGGMVKAFKFGSEESLEFRYVGLNMVQYEEGITMDNSSDATVNSLVTGHKLRKQKTL